MKLGQKFNKVEKSENLNDESQFSIDLTAKAIEILSSQIYEDAHLAIVRELGTNAADSHIEAGKKDIPFEVFLPSRFAPEFVIRDYGVGLSYEKAMKLYRTYFASDKTDSNDLTGCLGLGSKSPLAYTDQFQVTSWYNGEKSIYTIYKNDKGIPVINRTFHEPSDEPQGVEVRLSILQQDFYKFKEHANSVYKWFNPRPKVHGLGAFQGKEEILLSGDGWEVYRKNSYSYSDRPLNVIMGNVCYKIDINKLPFISSFSNDSIDFIKSSGVTLYVPVGSVDIAANRESMKTDGKNTFRTIKITLEKMFKEIASTLQKKIDQSKTYWEARCTYRELQSTDLNCFLVHTRWHGQEIKTKITSINFSDEIVYCDIMLYTPDRSTNSGISRKKVNEIFCDRKSKIFIGDSKFIDARIRHWVKCNNSCAYLLTKTSGCSTWPVGHKDHVQFESKTIDDFVKLYDLPLEKTSNLPDRPRSEVITRIKPSQIVVPDSLGKYWIEAKDFDFDSGGVFALVTGNKWHLTDKDSESFTPKKINNLLYVKILTDNENFVGVRSSEISKFQESDIWIPIDKFLSDFDPQDSLLNSCAMTNALNELEDRWYYECELCPARVYDLIKKLTDTDCNEKDFITLYDKLKSSKNKSVQFQFLSEILSDKKTNLDKISKIYFDECKKLVNQFSKKYTLIKHLSNSESVNKDLINYIALIKSVNSVKIQ